MNVELTRAQCAALQEVRAAGRKGLIVRHGTETMTQAKLVEYGLIYQEHGPSGHWKFTLAPIGRDHR